VHRDAKRWLHSHDDYPQQPRGAHRRKRRQCYRGLWQTSASDLRDNLNGYGAKVVVWLLRDHALACQPC
jgi:hypothetical protein